MKFNTYQRPTRIPRIEAACSKAVQLLIFIILPFTHLCIYHFWKKMYPFHGYLEAAGYIHEVLAECNLEFGIVSSSCRPQ